MTYLHIELAHAVELRFRILDTPISKLWLERMACRGTYLLDHPDRFYGFDDRQTEVNRAVQQIQKCIATINNHEKIIDRPFTTIYDQDCLNYLHNIFERYHGLLDQQDHEFWNCSPIAVKQALAELNLAVHRCEAVSRSNRPRFVCTWFGMPKTQTISPDLIAQYGQLNPAFGSVCLNYVEIGKTLEDLTQDNDTYIDDNAFKPFCYYSSDFVVRFFEQTDQDIATRLEKMHNYYNAHLDFFHSRGHNTFNDPRLLPYRLPVAVLETEFLKDHVIQQIQQHQYITRVYIL
jgi:hypothetical protein